MKNPNKNWILFLDDQFDDPDTTERVRPQKGFVCASTIEDAINFVNNFGSPSKMYLDFDLGIVNGKKQESIDFLKWLQENHPDKIPEYEVISKNVVGIERIHSFMNSWKKVQFFGELT